MIANELTNIYGLSSVVVKIKTNTQVASILGFYDIDLFHNCQFVYNFFLILVLRTACFNTKNFTHLLMMFL